MLREIDVFESDDDEEILRRIQRLRRPKTFKQRLNYFEELEDAEFSRRFRLSKDTCRHVPEQIQNRIQSSTNRNQAVSPATKLLLTLRFYACGSMPLTVCDFIGISESTACVILQQVTEAITSLRPNYVYMPRTREENIDVQLKFYRIARFPKVIGALDCTLIEIESPGGDNAEYYKCRKGWFAWNVQVVCDTQLQIRDLVARWPGSTHDQTIFNNSSIKANFERKLYENSLLLGDSGYTVLPYLIPPLLNPVTDEERLFNEAQIRTRNTIARCFGVWKRRFPIISLCMRVSLQLSQDIIIATAILHNLSIQQRNEIPEDEPEIVQQIRRHHEQGKQANLPAQNNGNNNRRLRLINEYFRNFIR